ncbi:TPA: lanthionine synthetase LanC family protein [Elizabethkingia anophelis]|uniref:lanthionine synthetase LanC family protein n=1 Tax=Elizabethkingia anophelis TaxID=1117645 RepID=UPI0021A85C28|nr:hypothetical protein [Elizabethkingia anophelis]MCT3682414.1 hypothetical protein [Elizabethkingia anophelis]MCT3701611.1 hypothetical protein [Elizabethkingia anophelis]MCT3770658.1 hypothetical protein [Elizabethkingia anophelis]MCT3780946.1 hypothetical protein [Elizabethkingia anophelis]
MNMASSRLLLNQLNFIKKNIQLNYKSFESDIGVLTGLSGFVLFLEYYQSTCNSKSDTTEELLNLCIEKINLGYNKSTHSEGISGLLWTIQFLQENNFIENEDNYVFKVLDPYIQDCVNIAVNYNNFDFMHGSTGYIFYLLGRFSKIEGTQRQSIESIIELFIKHLSVRLNEIIDYKYLKKEQTFQNRTYLGVAHGIAGIIMVLSKIALISKFKKESINLIAKYVFFLFDSIEYSTTKNKVSIFPSWLDQSSEPKSSALSWCSGDLGIGIALLNTAENIQDLNLKNKAFDILIHSSKRTTSGTSWLKAPLLCHGFFGAYKIFSRAYTITGEKEFKKAKEYWLKIGIDSIQKEIPDDLTLLNGQAGIGLALIDAYTNTDHSWGESLLIS